MKGLQKVNGEMNLIMLVYNIKRTISILGFEKMMQALKNWKPDYRKVIYTLKSRLMKMIYRQNERSVFYQYINSPFFAADIFASR